MLVMFRYKNYGPFKDEVILDMRAVKAYKEHPDNLITVYPDMPLLKIAAIYGANASGKSQFVDAYHTFKTIVQHSFRLNNKDDDHSFIEEFHMPFALCKDCRNADTEFEGIYRIDNEEYRYGFSYNGKEIKSEWLYRTSLQTNRTSVILERDAGIIKLGASVKRTCEKYLKDIDNDVLALSFFSSLRLNNMVFITTVTAIMLFWPVSLSRDAGAEVMLEEYFNNDFDEDEKERLLKFLNAIDVGIKDISIEKNGKKSKVYTYHLDDNGSLCEFDFSLESDGTRRAIAIYSVLRLATKGNAGLIMDEFHSQLHPLLQKYLLDMFYESSNGGQLIYTTHDTTMLDKRFTRRDQVWFTEKNENGESTLYSLADFKVRDFDSFGKDYLSGNYGAIPNLKDFSFNGGTADGEG